MKSKQPKTKSTSESAPADQKKKAPNADKDLQETIDALQKERDTLFEKLQRVSADYANYEKRVPKLVSDSVGYEKERILKSFLPALDNFEHTLLVDHSADHVDVVVKGVRIIYDQILDILKGHGVEQIQALKEAFNPAQHEAMMQRSEKDKENNVVLEEFQKGYTLNGRVIRPSKVIVNKVSTETDGDATSDNSNESSDMDENVIEKSE